MKFRVTQTSDWRREEVIEIATLDELLAFVKRSESPVIISMASSGKNHDAQLEVYDDYRE